MLRRETQLCSCKARLTGARDARAVGFSRFPTLPLRGHIVIHIAKSPFISIAYTPIKVKKEAVAIVKNLAVLQSKLIRRWSLLTVVSSFPHGASGNPVQASRAKHANEK